MYNYACMHIVIRIRIQHDYHHHHSNSCYDTMQQCMIYFGFDLVKYTVWFVSGSRACGGHACMNITMSCMLFRRHASDCKNIGKHTCTHM